MQKSGYLSDKQLNDFDRDGFLIIRRLCELEELHNITQWTEEVASFPEVPGKYMMYFEQSKLEPHKRILSRVEDFVPYHAGFEKLFNMDKMFGIVSELFGEPAVLFKDKINFKMSGGDGFKAHQDIQAGWDTYAKLHITALVSIDESTPENGCLELAAGHHKKGLIGEKWHPLEDDNEVRYVPYPMSPGDAVFFDSYTPHRSGPNLTDKPRRVLYVTYNRLSEGEHRATYYADKRRSYPPDCEREPGKTYVFRV
ncbi:MAG: phytanoyl-CoA dioxygenase family protein [Gammaproteobacteria bacterium]